MSTEMEMRRAILVLTAAESAKFTLELLKEIRAVPVAALSDKELSPMMVGWVLDHCCRVIAAVSTMGIPPDLIKADFLKGLQNMGMKVEDLSMAELKARLDKESAEPPVSPQAEAASEHLTAEVLRRMRGAAG